MSDAEWPVTYSAGVEPPDQWAVDLAKSILWALSGRQFGIHDTVARPCPQPPPWAWYRDGGYSSVYAVEVMIYRELVGWWPTPCGCYGGSCTLTGPRVVHLPGPVQTITAVTVAGVPLDSGDYSLEGDVLYRVDGMWPAQCLDRPLGEPGTWSVEYKRGVPVPAGVDQLTGMLAVELFAAYTGGKCRLPTNVTNVVRRGVTYQMYDPRTVFDSGKTGLMEIDMWLASVNPRALQAPPSVL